MNIKNKINSAIGQQGKELLTAVRGMVWQLRYLRKFSFAHSRHTGIFYFIIEPRYKHPGLADRLKAIVSCYHIAKNNGYEFKIIAEEPFLLSDYLSPAATNWVAERKDLEYSIPDTRFFIYSALRKGTDCKLKPGKQYHCYCYKGDDLFYVNGLPYEQQFKNLFHQLFKPAPLLAHAIEATGLRNTEYVAIHIRFVNALGCFENQKYPTLPPSRQQELILRCHNAIQLIQQSHHNTPVYVFSDSKRFIQSLADMPVKVLSSQNIAHLSHTTDKNEMAKTFLDFFIISQAKEVYRLVAKELYWTNFSLYAAIVGGKKIKEITV